MKAVRFRPPRLDPPSGLRWVLRRAFADPSQPVPPPPDAAAAFELAGKFDLAGRIGARTPREALEREMGAVAGDFRRTAQLVVARSLRYEVTVKDVAAKTAPLGVPLVLLKGSAIAYLGISAPGARSFGDLDILVPVDRIPDVRSVLVAAGWARSPLPASGHQDSPLTHTSLGMIELHSCIPGVRPPGARRSFDARIVVEGGYSEPLPAFDSAVRVPTRTVLIAHALEHGLVQHGYAPGSYPLFRFLADLQDLGADATRLREAGALVRDVDDGDLAAIGALVAALISGTALDLADSPARALLHHLVVGTLDSAYALSLKADPCVLRAPSDLPRPLAALAWVYKACVLTRPQVDAIYGPPKRWGG